MPQDRHRAECERDPIKYANRPVDESFDTYRTVREMMARLVAGAKGKAE